MSEERNDEEVEVDSEADGDAEAGGQVEPSEADLAEPDEEDEEEGTADVSSPSGDPADYSSGLTYDSDAGYLPRSVAQEYLRCNSDSDEGQAAG